MVPRAAAVVVLPTPPEPHVTTISLAASSCSIVTAPDRAPGPWRGPAIRTAPRASASATCGRAGTRASGRTARARTASASGGQAVPQRGEVGRPVGAGAHGQRGGVEHRPRRPDRQRLASGPAGTGRPAAARRPPPRPGRTARAARGSRPPRRRRRRSRRASGRASSIVSVTGISSGVVTMTTPVCARVVEDVEHPARSGRGPCRPGRAR